MDEIENARRILKNRIGIMDEARSLWDNLVPEKIPATAAETFDDIETTASDLRSSLEALGDNVAPGSPNDVAIKALVENRKHAVAVARLYRTADELFGEDSFSTADYARERKENSLSFFASMGLNPEEDAEHYKKFETAFKAACISSAEKILENFSKRKGSANLDILAAKEDLNSIFELNMLSGRDVRKDPGLSRRIAIAFQNFGTACKIASDPESVWKDAKKILDRQPFGVRAKRFIRSVRRSLRSAGI
jgi:hypothetical protein